MTVSRPTGWPERDTTNKCNGDGTCAAARLHLTGAKCSKCQSTSFDHYTDTPGEAFCFNCGEPYREPLP